MIFSASLETFLVVLSVVEVLGVGQSQSQGKSNLRIRVQLSLKEVVNGVEKKGKWKKVKLWGQLFRVWNMQRKRSSNARYQYHFRKDAKCFDLSKV